jgi:organic hydroperoxide reductase OsmC/OhrA
MGEKQHRYTVRVNWTGDRGKGTSSYRDYVRSYELEADGKPAISGSSDPAFLGDSGCWNPEELLVASLAACHQLWYLHLCAEAGVVVTAYLDSAEGVMTEEADGAGQFAAATLRPRVTVAAGSDPDLARDLHARAHAMCFVARSVNFPVILEPEIIIATA